MNLNNLHELIDRYEANYEMINDKEHDEIYKWKAVRHFRDVWFSEEAAGMPFSKLFGEARKEFSNLIDSKSVSPSAGIIKLAELYPQEVESLFRDVLFADDGGDLKKRQDNMDRFIAKFEALRAKAFPPLLEIQPGPSYGVAAALLLCAGTELYLQVQRGGQIRKIH